MLLSQYNQGRQNLNSLKMKRNWVRKLVGGLSFTTALFVFQACYGTPQDFGEDLYIKGVVRSKTTGNAISGIKVSVGNSVQYEITDKYGKYGLYTSMADNLKVTFEDIDGVTNGFYEKKDTVISPPDYIFQLDVNLDGK